MSYINKCNTEMGGVGIADNLRNYYRIYFGEGRGSGGGKFYFGLLVSSSRIHRLSTYEFITCTVIQGNIYYLIMILERQYPVHGKIWIHTVQKKWNFIQRDRLI